MKKSVKLYCDLLLCLIMVLGLCGCGSSDESGLQITYQVTEVNPSKQDMEDTLNKLQKRADAYSSQAEVYQEGDRQIVIVLPGIGENEDKALEELGRPGSLEFIAMKSDGSGYETVLDGKDVKDAEAKSQKDIDGDEEYVVQLTLTDEGTEKFAEATIANIGKTIWIMYDGQQISAPVVTSSITDGSPVISGFDSIDETKKLASFIRIGALPLELEKVSSE